MALRYVDSFDTYGTNDLVKMWSLLSVGGFGCNIDIVAGGGLHKNAIRLASSYSGHSHATQILDSQQTWVVGFSINVQKIRANTVAQIFSFRDGDTVQVEICREIDGRISVKRGSTTLGTTAIALPLTAWTHVAVKVKIHDSEGAIEVRINGSSTPALKLNGINTQNTVNATADRVVFGLKEAECTFVIDDLYILDCTGDVNNDFLGEVSVIAHSPTGDGTSSDWVPSEGTSHYALIDESPGSNADYITGSSGNTDLFTFTPGDLTGFTISGVVLKALAKKTDSGEAELALIAKSGATALQGAANVLSQDDLYYTHTLELDPDTNTTWTPESLAAAEFGVEAL